MDLLVFAAGSGWVAALGQRRFACAVGRGGLRPAAAKREGDGATPIGRWPLRYLLYRPDRGGPPATALPKAAIAPDDGWCDDPLSALYNRPVRLPFDRSHERLWRDDGLYDLVGILSHNDAPPVAGLGSAIFLHCARPGLAPTEGCVALARPDLEAVLVALSPGDAVTVLAQAPQGASSCQ